MSIDPYRQASLKFVENIRLMDDDDDEEKDAKAEEPPEYACAYCGIHDPSTLVMCNATNKWFCNGRDNTSGR